MNVLIYTEHVAAGYELQQPKTLNPARLRPRILRRRKCSMAAALPFRRRLTWRSRSAGEGGFRR